MESPISSGSPEPSGTGHPINVDLLIDGDIFVYRCGFAVEKTKYLVEDTLGYNHWDSAKPAKEHIDKYGGTLWSRKEVEPAENAIQAVRTALRGVTDKYWPKGEYWNGRIFLTGKGNFRESLDYKHGYKDNRDPSHRPKHYKAIKDYLITQRGAWLVNGMEADDQIGIEAYSRPVDKYVVVSNDKDLDQISGFHYDWTKNLSYYVNEEEAIKVFYKQLLSGDATDNIKGVMSVAKAANIVDPLGNPKACAQAVKDAYEAEFKDGWGEAVDLIATLVWIRKATEGNPGYKHPFWEHLNGEG